VGNFQSDVRYKDHQKYTKMFNVSFYVLLVCTMEQNLIELG